MHKLPFKDGSGKLPPPLILHWPHFSTIPHQPAREAENVLLILAGCPAINHALFYKEERKKWIIRNKKPPLPQGLNICVKWKWKHQQENKVGYDLSE